VALTSKLYWREHNTEHDHKKDNISSTLSGKLAPSVLEQNLRGYVTQVSQGLDAPPVTQPTVSEQ